MRTFSLVAVGAIVFGAGCQSAPSIVGEWTLKQPITASQGGVAVTIESNNLSFTADGKTKSTMTMKVMNQSVSVESTGTYTVAEQQLTTNTSEVKLNGQAIDLNNPMFAQMRNQLSQSGAFEFADGGRTLNLTAQGQTMAFSRK